MRYALITGASRGIGRAIAVELAKDSCHVIINYKSNHEAARETKVNRRRVVITDMGGIMTNQEIAEKVHVFMTDRLEYEETSLQPEAELKRDLGMTSLDAVETSIFIKRTFGFQPERGAVKSLVTLQDLYDYIAVSCQQSVATSVGTK